MHFTHCRVAVESSVVKVKNHTENSRRRYEGFSDQNVLHTFNFIFFATFNRLSYIFIYLSDAGCKLVENERKYVIATAAKVEHMR